MVVLVEDKLNGLEMLAQLSEARSAEDEKQRETQAQILVNLASDAELFHTPDGRAYATIVVNSHRENWPITLRGSGPFKNWLRQRFFAEYGKPPGSQALQDAVGVLEARAQFEGPEVPVCVRLAEANGSIYLDLCDKEWRAIEITPEGWQVVSDPPAKFRRAKGMLPLPEPRKDGCIDDLRQFVNVDDEESWILLVAWLIATLRPCGPFPVLLLQGEQGSAKSTTARVLRSLVDPNTAPLRTTPRDERDLMITANNSWILSFDNLSGIPSWLSDAICRLATGGGFSTRTLYENDEETIFAATRPVVANGIDELATRHDLLDRAVILNLPPIPEEKRKPEKQFWREFEEARPYLLGALLDAVAVGLRNFDQVSLQELPRMADFAEWVVACEPALPWEPGGFLEAYAGNRAGTVELALESNLVAQAVRELLEQREEWEGTATDLLNELNNLVPEEQTKRKSWPKSPATLSGKLRRAATFLRQTGVDVEFYREDSSDRRRLIRLKKESCVRNVRCVRENMETLDLQGFELRTQNDDFRTQTLSSDANKFFASELEPAEIKASDDLDATNDNFHSLSNSDSRIDSLAMSRSAQEWLELARSADDPDERAYYRTMANLRKALDAGRNDAELYRHIARSLQGKLEQERP